MTNNDTETAGSSQATAGASSSSAGKVEITEKVRVLCLHGYRQDGNFNTFNIEHNTKRNFFQL